MSAYSDAVLATSGLLDYLRLNETTSTMADSGSGGLAGTVGSAVTRGSTGLLTYDTDKAATFAGGNANSYVDFGDHAGFSGDTSFTVEMLVKHDGTGATNFRRLASKKHPIATVNGWEIYLYRSSDGSAAHSPVFSRWCGGVEKYVDGSFDSTGAAGTAYFQLTAGTVYHVVCVYDAATTTSYIYVNGVLRNKRNFGGSTSMTAVTDTLTVGSTSDHLAAGAFGGVLDEVAIYNVALSAATISAHYAAIATARNSGTHTVDAVLVGTPPDAPAISIAGTFDGYTLGPDRYGRVLIGVTAAGTGAAPTGVKLWRATASGGSFSEVTANCDITNTSPGKWLIVDKRPAYGTPAITLGSTAYYKAKATNGGSDSPFTSEANAISNVDQTAIESNMAARLSANIAGDPTYSSYSDAYGGQLVMQMAYAYLRTGTAQYLTDALNRSSWVASNCINADGLYVRPSDSTHVYRDFLFRNVMHHAIAARLLTHMGDLTDAATLRNRAATWAKAGIDKLARSTLTFAGFQANSQTAWAASTAIVAGEIRRPTTGTGRAYRAMNAGTTGGSEPTWPTPAGSTVTDNGITWKETTRTGAIFSATYSSTGPGYTSAGDYTIDMNQNSECAAALALLISDHVDFQVGGSYHAAAQTIMADHVALLTVFQTSAGALPIGDAVTTIDTHYASFTLHTMAMTYFLEPSLDASLPLWIGRALDWLIANFGAEPTVSNAGSGGYATRKLIAEVIWRDAAYRVMGRTNPLAGLHWTTAYQAHDDGVQPYVYVQGGNSVDSPVPLYEYMFDGAAVRFSVLEPSTHTVDGVLVAPPVLHTHTVDGEIVASGAGAGSPRTHTVDALLAVAAAASEYDIRLGPLRFLWPADTIAETVGDGLDVVGAALSASDRRPRPLKLQLPIRGAVRETDPTEFGLQLRRAVRALFDNAAWRLGGFYFTWVADPDLDCWLLVGGGEMSETDPGLSFGDFTLDLSDVYIAGRPGTHRPGRRAVIGDRRGGLVPRASRTAAPLYSIDFASQPLPDQPLFLPGDITAALASGNRPVDPMTAGLERFGRRLWQAASGTDGEVISFLPDPAVLPARDRYIDVEEVGCVKVWDATGNVPSDTAYTGEQDIDPAGYGWDRIFGDVLTADRQLAIENGVCRLIWLGAGANAGLAVEYWDDVLGHYRRIGRVLHATGVAEQHVVELTPERGVLEWRAGRYAMRAILQRGWWGPRLESYDDGGSTARLEYAPKATAGAAVSAIDQTPAWVKLVSASGAQSLRWALGAADDAIYDDPAVIDGTGNPTAAIFGARRTRVLVAQLSPPPGPAAEALASLSLVDARAVPVLVGRSG